MPPRSPAAAKYKRAIEGLELIRTSPTPSDDKGDLQSLAQTKPSSTNQKLYRRLFGNEIAEGKVFFNANKRSNELLQSIDPVFDDLQPKRGPTRRQLPSAPIRILQAPGLEDDFYLNLVDWEPKQNLVTVLLSGGEVYFWKASSLTSSSPLNASSVDNLKILNRMSFPNTGSGIVDKGCVVKWSGSGDGRSGLSDELLAVGTRFGWVEVWDAARQERLHLWRPHQGARCGVLAWQSNSVLSSGGKDQVINHFDLRTPRGLIQRSAVAHSQEVCGLQWDRFGSGLLASGGNDNQLLIWDQRNLSRTQARAMP